MEEKDLMNNPAEMSYPPSCYIDDSTQYSNRKNMSSPDIEDNPLKRQIKKDLPPSCK